MILKKRHNSELFFSLKNTDDYFHNIAKKISIGNNKKQYRSISAHFMRTLMQMIRKEKLKQISERNLTSSSAFSVSEGEKKKILWEITFEGRVRSH